MARRAARKPSLAKHLGADARDFRAIDADARDIQHRVHALQARDKPLGHAGGALASEEVGLYKTMSGAVGLRIRRHTGGSRVYYSYTGKWGAGSGGSFEDMARALEVALHGKRGVKVVKDFFAHAQSAPPGHAAGRRKRIDPHSADAALEYSAPIEQAARQALEVARETRAFLRGHPSAGAVFDAKKRIVAVYTPLSEVLQRSGPGTRIAIDRIGKLPIYGDHEHPFARAREAAAHLDRVYGEADRLRNGLSQAAIGDRARVEGALDAVLAHPWVFEAGLSSGEWQPSRFRDLANSLTGKQQFLLQVHYRHDPEARIAGDYRSVPKTHPHQFDEYVLTVSKKDVLFSTIALLDLHRHLHGKEESKEGFRRLLRQANIPLTIDKGDHVKSLALAELKSMPDRRILASASFRPSGSGFAAGRHAGATPIVWETLAKVVEDSPAVLTPGGAAIVVRAHEPTFRTHVNTAIKLGLLVPVAIPGRKRTDLFTIPPEHQVHLDVRHDRPPVPRPAPAITGVNAFVLQGLSIVNPDLFTGQGTGLRLHSTSAPHVRRLIALRALEPVPGTKKSFRLTELGRQTLRKEAVFLRDNPHMQENLVRMREATADQIAAYLHHVFG